jgi:hypothetical protein
MTVSRKHTNSNVSEILRKVREQIAVQDPDQRLDLEVGDDDFRIDHDEDGDWIYICVTPRKTGIRPYDYAEMLGKIEKNLNKQGHENVLLVPTLAEWDED